MKSVEREVIERYLDGYPLRMIAILTGLKRPEIDRILEANMEEINEIKEFRARKIEAIRKKKQVPDYKDPRSLVCQTIQSCSHSRCHLAPRCPAHQYFLMKLNRRRQK